MIYALSYKADRTSRLGQGRLYKSGRQYNRCGSRQRIDMMTVLKDGDSV